jgi:hypothetical protein
MSGATTEPTHATSSNRADDRVEMAYDAAVAAVAQQDVTLGNLRGRATGLLSAVTIGTTFAAGLGLFSVDPTRGTPLPSWSKWTLLALVICVGGLCLAVMWPVTMCFGVDAGKVLARGEQGEDIDGVRRYVIGELITGHRANQQALMAKFRLYRLAVIVTTVETAVLLLALTVNGG